MDTSDTDYKDAYVLQEVVTIKETKAAKIIGHHIFYNNSFFDGNNPLANADDDNAIDTTKKPCCPLKKHRLPTTPVIVPA